MGTNNSMNQKNTNNNSWVNKVDKKRESGPLYLRNSSIPAPPNKCPPPPPGPPGPFTICHSMNIVKTPTPTKTAITTSSTKRRRARKNKNNMKNREKEKEKE